MNRKLTRWTARIALPAALAVALGAAAAVPSAVASVVVIRHDESKVASGGSCTTSHTAATLVSARLRSEAGTSGPTRGASTITHPVASGDTFHWSDAGIGGGGAFALTALAVGGVAATYSRRRVSRRSAQPTS